jgi:hypothetical protein
MPLAFDKESGEKIIQDEADINRDCNALDSF